MLIHQFSSSIFCADELVGSIVFTICCEVIITLIARILISFTIESGLAFQATSSFILHESYKQTIVIVWRITENTFFYLKSLFKRLSCIYMHLKSNYFNVFLQGLRGATMKTILYYFCLFSLLQLYLINCDK